MTRSRPLPLPGAPRPALRWYVAVARLHAGRAIARVDRRAVSRAFAALAVLVALNVLRHLLQGGIAP